MKYVITGNRTTMKYVITHVRIGALVHRRVSLYRERGWVISCHLAYRDTEVHATDAVLTCVVCFVCEMRHRPIRSRYE